MAGPILKVMAYITRRCGEGTQVLVFEHRDHPDAGLQVPAGTVDPGEEIEAALRREALEESGLAELILCGRLATCPRDGEAGPLLYHVFHLEAPADLPEAWGHTVTAGEEDRGLVFLYSWLPVAEAMVRLSGGQGDHLALIP